MRESLINLRGRAKGLLELESAKFLIKTPQSLNSLHLFPYYGNYVKLPSLEYRILHENGVVQPKKVAFVGSGPMPLTSFIMDIHHMKFTHFDNFDADEAANGVARQLVVSDAELEKRMKFETCDMVDVKEKLSEYDCIFLAALVGLNKDEKLKILSHLRKYMKEDEVELYYINTTHHKMWISYSEKMQTPEISQGSKVHCKITNKLAFLVWRGRLQELQKEGLHKS
ncbi:hypothetical protein POTOM_056246 [Populus tomentosa]|uniref:Nicotianamine synthase n=1 Tax=Populus tomentosa TaxID=118781 RepID=A0A8X7Y1M2_POPTO|nr:hypothetical protein POTOM_056246 [Populus tomentosa]